MVILGSINSWKLDDWLALSKIKDWNVTQFCDGVRLEGKGIVICLLLDGKVEMVTLS
ncbi:hypothetical protein [Gilliamella sp. ESL0250]|uniref:hypothetical protein n=1 Tax=Gilliamella sp. ESL0250 TaxID=2705036 RepID=UPI001580C15F|nr:hypothetical protein [Gilliamella sp. ESL0250]NUF50255.1 hypothetical protein [Gilliamella sp. ESL0250]